MFLGADYPGRNERETNVNEGEVPVRMKYRQLLAVAPALAWQAG